MTIKFIGTKELRQNLFAISKEVGNGEASYVVMNKNKPLFTMRPFVDEEITLRPTKKLGKWIKEARVEHSNGENFGPFRSVSDLMKSLNK